MDIVAKIIVGLAVLIPLNWLFIRAGRWVANRYNFAGQRRVIKGQLIIWLVLFVTFWSVLIVGATIDGSLWR